MISADELRKIRIAEAGEGYSKKDVDELLDAAADTIDAYINENESVYHKLEVLASKIEEYRAEEDIIKTAIIKAERTAEEIRVEAKSKATSLLEAGEQKVQEIVESANAKAEQISNDAQKIKEEAEQVGIDAKVQAEAIISEARERAAEILKEKTDAGNAIIADAEKKANEAINSSKIVAQNILDQAKEISEDLIAKSREEKEAYELLVSALKNDAKDFIERVKALYSEQLEFLGSAKLERDSEEKIEKAEAVSNLQDEVESLVSEMAEIENAIPESISIEQPETDITNDAPAEDESVIDFESITVEAVDLEEEIEEVEEEADEIEEAVEEVEEVIEESEDDDDDLQEITFTEEEDDEPADPMEAVAAFSQTNNEEKSLFEDENALPFENFFNVNTNDAHGDRNQVISLVPPEDEEEDDAPKFKGFFKKRK